MASSSPKGEVSFDFADERYTLIFDFEAIAYFEDIAGDSMIDVMAGMEKAQAAGKTPKISHLGYLLQAGFQRHQPEMTPQEALAMAVQPDVQRQLGVAVSKAMPDADAVAGEEGNAKAPANKKKASTGKRPSRAHSKQG